MNDPTVLAVVVAHGSGRWLSAAVRALEGQTFRRLEIQPVAVGDVELPPPSAGGAGARTLQPISLPDGTGFGPAVNEAVQRAGSAYTYVLVLHDDAAPEPDVVEQLVERAEAGPEIAAVGAKLVEWDDPDILQEVGGWIDRFAARRSGLEAHEVDHGQHDDADDVLFCSACLLVRREAFEEAGGFDPGAWPLYDEVDLCWRFRRGGGRVVVVPRARVRHAVALVRGLRRSERPSTAGLDLRRHAERGRLRFMLKHYAPVSLAALLPQYFLIALLRILGGVARRDLWHLRAFLAAWFGMAAELPQLRGERRRAGAPEVDDQALLRLAARGAALDRRYERTALLGRVTEVLRVSEARGASALRDPITWVWVAAALVVVITLRSVLFGGAFVLGEVRPFPGLTDALSSYAGRLRPDGFDRLAPGTPGSVLLGLLRSITLGSAALAEKLLLLIPLVLTAFGASRLGMTIGLDRRPRLLLAVLAMVNPITLALVREGEAGALVAGAGSMWIAAGFLAPPFGEETAGLRLRRRSRWALGWAAVVAVHPPALVWLVALGAGIALARAGDGCTRHRARQLAVGVGGALLLTIPWSLQVVGARSPFVGRSAGTLLQLTDGLEKASLGGGLAFLGWVGMGLIAAYFVGATRTTGVLIILLGLAWVGGVAALVPVATALVAVGWCTVALLAFVTQRIGEELPRYELGFRHAAVIAIALGLGASWVVGAGEAIGGGTRAHTRGIVAAGEADIGRVLWIDSARDGLRVWGTDGFERAAWSFPAPRGPEEQRLARAIAAAREGRTHRLGAILTLFDVSHVVALTDEGRRGLEGQADLAPRDEQAGALVYRNDAWSGSATLLSAPPRDPLSPEGLAGLVRRIAPVESSMGPDGATRVVLPEEEREGEILYLAVGARSGWSVDGADVRPGGAGVWARADEIDDVATIAPPPDWAGWLHPLQGLVVALLVAVWLGGAYLSGPERTRAEPAATLPPSEGLPRTLAYVPLIVLVAAGSLAWAAVRSPESVPTLSSAWYCPPIGRGFEQAIALANPGEASARYLVRTDLTADPIRSGTLDGHERVTLEADPEEGYVVEVYGGRIGVASEVSRDGNRDASLCASQPSERNVFPEGGRAATRAVPRLFEAYVLYNPYPDVARASVRFIASDETIAPPAWQDIRIEPGERALVDPEAQFEPMLDLSAEVTVWQGRAIVARRLRTVEQVTWSLGVEPTRGGVLPWVSTDEVSTTIIGANPDDESARVSVFAAGGEEAPPRERFEVPARGRATFDVADVAPNLSELLVRLESDRPVALESLVLPDDRSVVALLPPMEPTDRWLVPLAEGRSLVVVNPGQRHVRVDLERLGPGPEISDTTVSPGGTARVEPEGDEPFGVYVRARGGAVTLAAVGERGTMAGVPLR